MAKRFLFLKIFDPEIVSLIAGIRDLAMGGRPRSAVHVTVRGPYDREIPVRQLQHCRQLLASDPLIFDGAGEFETPGAHVVYFKVRHPALRRIWWKPDFPVRAFGFNPHVTVYEGVNARRASLLKAFLAREDLKLLTWDFDVTAHVSDHRDLFEDLGRPDEPFLGLVNRGLVRADILARLARALKITDMTAGQRAFAG